MGVGHYGLFGGWFFWHRIGYLNFPFRSVLTEISNNRNRSPTSAGYDNEFQVENSRFTGVEDARFTGVEDSRFTGD